jgi:putative FmdB family regulatory protein
MPIYEYRCHGCGEMLEVIQKFSDVPLRECPECRGKLAKLVSNTSFVLKGSGWYADGYSSSAKESGPEKPSTPGKPKTESGTEKKPETKTAAG